MPESIKKLVSRLTKRVHVSSLVGFALIFIVGMLVYGSVQAIQDNFERQTELDAARQQADILDLEVATLRFQKAYYSTDEYAELQARKLLNKALPGEKLIILPPTGLPSEDEEQRSALTSKPANESPLKDRSNLEQWLYFLFGDKRS